MISPVLLINHLRFLCEQVPNFTAELNSLDGQLGDGDLGATLGKCAECTQTALKDIAPDASLSDIFRVAAMACMQASGSSFGTLLAQAFITASQFSVGKNTLSRVDTARLMHQIVDRLAERGGAALGDKTVLDALHALALTLEQPPQPDDLRQSLTAALATFRQQPNRIGRARMFADRSVGLDDPGMVALLRLTETLNIPETGEKSWQ